jgi:hypothetical protein
VKLCDVIEKLRKIEGQFGSFVDVYFDCLECHQSFTPNVAETKIVVMVKGSPKETRSRV